MQTFPQCTCFPLALVLLPSGVSAFLGSEAFLQHKTVGPSCTEQGGDLSSKCYFQPTYSPATCPDFWGPEQEFFSIIFFLTFSHIEILPFWVDFFDLLIFIRVKTITVFQHNFLLFLFGGTVVWIQGFSLARQVLYHLNQIPSPFGFSYLFG
jgi:hypothetical protein